MRFWIIHRVFAVCTLGIYVAVLVYLDFPEIKTQAARPVVWLLVYLQILRHAMFGMTLGYHRYFSHSAFKAKRWFEFLLSYSCAAANQGGMSWWAANHRHHHAHCDTKEDQHSPVAQSLAYAYIGWANDPRIARRRIKLRYPETVWMDKWCFLVPWLEWLLVWFVTGSRAFATLVVLLPAWLSPIGTLSFNIGSHGGTADEKGCTAKTYINFSAFILGEHKHQDHHRFPGKARRPGPDLAYHLILRPMARLGAIWDLRAN
ncbi:MAG: fatty acid desaturase [Gammaproteobacteria bacterium]